MSTFLGNKSVGGDPLLHMSSDIQTASELDSDVGENTVFHSDLPYVFVRERFEIDSYTTWSGADGGRKFALPSALTTFRTNNPDLAYFLMLEDSSGNKWIHDPSTTVMGMYFYYQHSGNYYGNEVVGCFNGYDYQVAYTDSDTQLEELTQNEIHSSIDWTFRTWDSNDTHVTVFKTPLRGAHESGNNFFQHHDFPGWAFTYLTTPGILGGTDLESVGLNVTKVTFLFLNITHTVPTFERQHDFSYDYIKITPDEFKVNNIDLADFTPLVTHGFVSENTIITPYTAGDLVSGKAEGVNRAGTKISSSDQLTGGDSSVLEILPDPGTLTGWEADFHNQVIERNGVEVFNSTWAQRALFVAGERTIDFDTSVTLTSSTTTSTITSTQSGTIGSVDADTVYLASVIWAGEKVHSTSIMAAGDNMVAFFTVGEKNAIANTRWSSSIWYYLNITSAGVCTVKVKWQPGTGTSGWYPYTAVGLGIPSMTIRLISLVSL